MRKDDLFRSAELILPRGIYDVVARTGKATDLQEELRTVSAELGRRWVESGRVDQDAYREPVYLAECLHTYLVSSEHAVNGIVSYFEKTGDQLESILDHYNGVGLTTMNLIRGFPETEVVIYNTVPAQFVATHELFEGYGLRIPKGYTNIPPNEVFDMVVSLETIEHQRKPVRFVKKLMELASRFLVETTSFRSPHIYGHHAEYVIGKETVNGTKAARAVLNTVRERFELVHSGYNGKPRIWRRKPS